MNEHPILGHVVLGCSPMIDKRRSVVAKGLMVSVAEINRAQLRAPANAAQLE